MKLNDRLYTYPSASQALDDQGWPSKSRLRLVFYALFQTWRGVQKSSAKLAHKDAKICTGTRFGALSLPTATKPRAPRKYVFMISSCFLTIFHGSEQKKHNVSRSLIVMLRWGAVKAIHTNAFPWTPPQKIVHTKVLMLWNTSRWYFPFHGHSDGKRTFSWAR